jgi:non-specific serine/threonine protein kinase
MLLVIDNCEHLIDACAQVAAELLARCPKLQILATSREPLNITGEMLWQVPTFAVPDPNRLAVLDLLMQFESLRLFVERASAIVPGFALTFENAPAVVEICRHLDGIPLAIELAAARVKVLPVEQIASYLSGVFGARFSLLTQGNRAAMPRHQTLRATIDWSYDLLDEAERSLFRRLAVFRGGFTLEALEQIVASDTAASLSPLPNTLDLLSQLVDKSLVIVERQGGQNRYRLLETLREYALEQFADAKELKRLQQCHAETFLRLADQAEPELVRANQQLWLDRLEVEHGNLRAALDFLIDNDFAQEALRLATVLHGFWEIRGYVSEGRGWLEAALALRSAAPHEVQARALNAAGQLAFRQGDFDYERQLHEEALLLFQQAEDEIGIAHTLNYLATNDMERGQYESAERRLEQALEISRNANDELGTANTLARLGSLAWDHDNDADASRYHGESLRIYRKLDMPLSIAFESLRVGDAERMLDNVEVACTHYQETLSIAKSLGHRGLVGASLKSLGLLASKQGEYEQARLYHEEALQIFRELGDKVHTAFALSHLGFVAQKLGEYSRAMAYFSPYLQIMYDVGYKWPTFQALEDIAALLAETEQHAEAAARFLGAAGALRKETGIAVAPYFEAKHERMSTTLRLIVGDERFVALWQEGEATPLAQIVADATQLTLS